MDLITCVITLPIDVVKLHFPFEINILNLEKLVIKTVRMMSYMEIMNNAYDLNNSRTISTGTSR